MELLMQ